MAPTNLQEFDEDFTAEMHSLVENVEDFERTFGITLSEEEKENITYKRLVVKRLIMKACSGDAKALQEVLDRWVGKPKQINENINVNYNYLDFLEQCDKEDQQLKKVDVIDVKAIPKTKSEELEDLGL